MNEHNLKFRVLALDGGGIRGAYTAAVLREFEHATNERIADCFDLIVGTSTGGLIALGLGLGHSAEEILEFYRSHGPRIFPSSIIGDRGRWVRQVLWSSKYRAGGLQTAVIDLLGEKTLLGASKSRLVIPAFNVTRGEVTCFKTRHHPSFIHDHLRPVWEIAMATSAAPTFFPAHRASWGTLYVDGGVWANCPALVGVIEATKYLGKSHSEIDVLSVGTISSPFYLDDKRRFGQILPPTSRRGFLTSGPRLLELLMQATASSIHQQASIVLRPENGHDEALIRIDNVENKKRFAMDDCRRLDDLIGLGEHAGRAHCARIRDRFLRAKADPFISIPILENEKPKMQSLTNLGTGY